MWEAGRSPPKARFPYVKFYARLVMGLFPVPSTDLNFSSVINSVPACGGFSEPLHHRGNITLDPLRCMLYGAKLFCTFLHRSEDWPMKSNCRLWLFEWMSVYKSTVLSVERKSLFNVFRWTLPIAIASGKLVVEVILLTNGIKEHSTQALP